MRIKPNRDRFRRLCLVTENLLQTYSGDIPKITKADDVTWEDDSDWNITIDLPELRELIASFSVHTTPIAEKRLLDHVNPVHESESVDYTMVSA